MIEIKNMGKNLWNGNFYSNSAKIQQTPNGILMMYSSGSYFEVTLSKTNYTLFDNYIIPYKVGIDISVKVKYKNNKNLILNVFFVGFENSGKTNIVYKQIYSDQIAVFKSGTDIPNNIIGFKIILRTNGINDEVGDWTLIEDVMIVEGDYTNTDLEYSPALNEKLQLNTEPLFGYAGVFDEYLGDGKVLRRWKRADLTDLTINDIATIDVALTNVYRIKIKNTFSGISGIRAYDYFTSDIVLKANGTVLKAATDWNGDYEHWYGDKNYIILAIDKTTIDAETGVDLNEKALNYLKKMTIIYQLATPVVEDIQPSGELNLYPGDNYIIGPDYGIISIEGDKKYLYG